MKIIITKTFLKDFQELFNDSRFLQAFIKKLSETKLIFLNNEFYKFKFYLKMVSIRGILFINIHNYYIPILLTKKSNKTIGENLILNKYIKEILDLKLIKMAKDLQNNNYTIYD